MQKPKARSGRRTPERHDSAGRDRPGLEDSQMPWSPGDGSAGQDQTDMRKAAP